MSSEYSLSTEYGLSPGRDNLKASEYTLDGKHGSTLGELGESSEFGTSPG